MGGVQLPGPVGQGGVNADIADGTLVLQVAQLPGSAGRDCTYGDRLAPPCAPRRHRVRQSEALPREAAAFRDRVLFYLEQFRVPTKIELGHLWNARPVVSLGESHDETAAIAQIISRVILNFGRQGDLIGFEGDPEEQAAVDSVIRSGDATLSERAENIRPVLLACRERKVDMVFMGAGSSGRTSDSGMFEVLNRRVGGQLSGRRMLLWTGKAHGLMNHPGSYGGSLVNLVVDELGREDVSIVNLISRKGKMFLSIPPHGDLLSISLSEESPVLIPTAGPDSPFATARFYLYTAAATKSADYIGIV